MTYRKKSKKMDNNEYDQKRQRNNEAVRKSREKARLKSEKIEARILYLRRENNALTNKKLLLKKELKTLKDLFLAHSVNQS